MALIKRNTTPHQAPSDSTTELDLEKGGSAVSKEESPLPPLPPMPLTTRTPPEVLIPEESSNGPSHSNKWIFISLIVLIGAASAAAFVSLGAVGALNDSQQQFVERSSELTLAIQTAAQDYELFGLWIHQACQRTPNPAIALNESYTRHLGFCTREEFHRLHDYIMSVGVEVQALEFVPNITDDARDIVERDSKAWFAANYPHVEYEGFTRVVPDGLPGLRTEPEMREPFYFPLHYVEPVWTNEAAIDLNPYSNPARRKAIDTAIATWKPAFSDRLKLVQETDPNAYGLGLMHPGVPVDEDDYTQPTRSLSQIIIRIPALLGKAARIALVKTDAYIFEGADHIFLGGVHVEVNNGVQMLSSLPQLALEQIPQPRGTRYFQTTVDVADRQWTIVVTSDAYQPALLYVILGGSIIFVASIILAVWFYTNLVRVAKLNQVRSEAEAEKSKIALKEAVLERELNEFIAHEVRNPLSSAIAALSFVSATANDPTMVRDEKARKTLQDDIRIMDASLQFINELLRNMLDLHRAADKQMKLDMSPTDLLRDVLEPVASILFMRGAKVDVLTECPKNLIVTTDRMRLKQIILNLAANSTKFVERGYIRLRAEVIDNNVCLFVEDSGPGIPPEKRDRLFAKFQESLDMLNQGTGIGLCVCKNLSELMKAEIYLDADFVSGVEGCPGTRFAVRLNQEPLEMLEPTNSVSDSVNGSVSNLDDLDDVLNGLASKSRGDLSSLKLDRLPHALSILFVDDDTVLRKMFARSLQRIAPNWDLNEACNGETALRLVESKTFDIIFIDQYMASIEKQMLGTETARALRAKGFNSIICGLSANDTEQQFLDAGANVFMFKPFPCEKRALRSEILRVLHAGASQLGHCHYIT